MAFEILNAFDKPPSYDTVSILLLGGEGVGKQRLARAIINIDTHFSVAIRTATSLPLSNETKADRPRIDFIAFMIDLTDKESIKEIEKCFEQVDVEYFLGRSCLVACQVEDTLKNIIAVEHVIELGKKYQLQTLYALSHDEMQLSAIAKRIMQLVLTATCFRNHVTPAVVESTK